MTLLKKTTPPIKSTKHSRKVQWDHLKRLYFEFRALFDLQQSGVKKLDVADGKNQNLGYSKKAKATFYKWFVENFGPGGEIEGGSPIVPNQTMFDEFRGYAYMLHQDESLRGGIRVFAQRAKRNFTLAEYEKMSRIDGMKPQQRVVLSEEDKKFYEKNKELYQRVKARVHGMKRQGVL